MSDTFFTAPPHWEWLIVLYFFIGGIAGGSYFIAALLDLFGTPQDRPVVRLGYYVAFVGAILSGILLTVDLTRPERFWHMLIQAKTGWPMFKWWSPMSVGSWGITLFGMCAFLSVLGALAEAGWIRWPPLRRLHQGPLRVAIAMVGGVLGFFVAGYTGVLLSVTNRPIWADTNLLGLLFVLSAASTAAAALILLSLWHAAWAVGSAQQRPQQGAKPQDDKRWRNEASATLRWLSRLDSGALVLELMALIALVVSLGAVARVWLDAWGALLIVGVVLVGILLPLTVHVRPRLLGRLSLPLGAVLVLLGGFLLRVVIVLSSEGV